MYELNELEKKWIAYKRQKLRKISIMTAAFIGVATISFAVSYTVLAKKENNTTVAAVTQKLEQNITTTDVAQLAPVCETPLSSQKEIVLISPQENGYNAFDKTKVIAENSHDFQSMEPQENKQQPQIVAKTVVQKQQTPPKIVMETKGVNKIELLERRYKNTPDTTAALELSSEYYKIGDYSKALKWAMDANSQDSKNEKSWILFAKSSYKLGHKQDALKALENFGQTTNSDAVKTTLNQIKNNEL